MDTEKIFRDMLVDIAKKLKYEDYSLTVTPSSSDGANFTSALYTAVISAPDKEDLYIFGKVANVNEKLRGVLFNEHLYDVERIAYEELVEIYKKTEDKHCIPEEDKLAFPKVYGFNTNIFEETVILENLMVKGYSVHDRLVPVDWRYASKAVEVLAGFHALSMVYAEENPDSFKIHCEKLSSSLEKLYDTYNMDIEKSLPRYLPMLREENRDRLKAFLDNNKDKMNFATAFTPVRKPVLVHADFKQGNLMHRYNEDGSIDMVLFDLQTIRCSSGVMDLLFFIFTGTDAAFRERHYSQLVDHYYSTLSRRLEQHGLSPDKVYPREDFDFELQERLHYGLLVALFALPVITVDTTDAPNTAEMTSVGNVGMKTGRIFPERLNGIIDDFVKWGVI